MSVDRTSKVPGCHRREGSCPSSSVDGQAAVGDRLRPARRGHHVRAGRSPPVTSTRSGHAHRAAAPGAGARPVALDHRGPVAERLPPGAVVGIPADGVGQTLFEGDDRLPAQLLADLGGVEEVAAVVARPVGDDLLERLGLAGGGQDRVGDLLDRSLDPAAHVVGLAHDAVLQDQLDGPAVVVDVQPLPLVLGRLVERQRVSSRARAVNRGITFSGNW